MATHVCMTTTLTLNVLDLISVGINSCALILIRFHTLGCIRVLMKSENLFAMQILLFQLCIKASMYTEAHIL